MTRIKFALLISLLLINLAGCTVFDRRELSELNEMEAKIVQTEKSKLPETKTMLPSEPTAEKIDPQTFESLVESVAKVILKTDLGDIELELYSAESPNTVNNFLNLAARDFYDGTAFHRVIKDFMIQGGDPNTKTEAVDSYGRGGPGYKFNDEFNSRPLVKGSLAMANSGPNSNGSQFFIVTAESTPWLDGKHTNFGFVVSGLEVVTAIENVKTGENDRPLSPVRINDIVLIKK